MLNSDESITLLGLLVESLDDKVKSVEPAGSTLYFADMFHVLSAFMDAIVSPCTRLRNNATSYLRTHGHLKGTTVLSAVEAAAPL